MKREQLAKLGSELIGALECNGANTSDALRVGSALVGIITAGANEICESIEQQREPSGTDLLQAWITRDPSFRVVERVARIGDRILIEVRSKSGLHESQTQHTIDSAIRTVLMIAMGAGEK